MKIVLQMLIVLLIPLFSPAHGEDTAGPHGGVIRMPGTFHTELVREEDSTLKIYLLDVQFANPMVKNSSITVKAVKSKKSETLGCMAMEDHFHCSPPINIKKGTIVILPVRDGAKGIEAKYPWPMKTKTGKELKPLEGHHHTH